jgi:hypothetical protein
MSDILLFISVMTHFFTMLRLDSLSVKIGAFGLAMDFVNFINKDTDINILMNILDMSFTMYTIRLYKELGLRDEERGATISLILTLVYNSMLLSGIRDKYLLL